MTILVTGGAGYIGSHTCVALLDAGYDIVVVDSFSNSFPKSLERAKQITGKEFPVHRTDLLNDTALYEVFRGNKIDAVIHFAGLKAVGESVSDPLRYYENNIVGTLNLLANMQNFGVKQMVFSSSATVYGMQNSMPVKEDTPLFPTSPYGRTKMMLEMIISDMVTANPDWGVASLRYFNPIGAHRSGRIGENPNGIPNNLLPFISQVAVGRRPYLTVNGDDYPTPDGTCIRDYIHVMDLAEGHVHALRYLETAKGIETVNLGTGRGYSVLEVLHAFEKASGVNIPYQIGPRRPGDIPISYADVSKAHTLLGWSAKRDLAEMCMDTWRWQANNPHGYDK
ncbi:UDP-glucose 4-epimerase GalE [Alicyclobacillus ferrooxydans]|uniref:UDP-glucose 4-epimerase n=1 Tax=Alicyclobacillus ferrooxydans TaxID=471514 RepID=A0A0P9CEV2_9BACL|nr:UDP-glucose 4-epimerase GalE [Alicyclobacillus ferrooxydans]KPV44353.1 UDP-galactose-4-epimerase [Alicyclobacillus ferrooxydans]